MSWRRTFSKCVVSTQCRLKILKIPGTFHFKTEPETPLFRTISNTTPALFDFLLQIQVLILESEKCIVPSSYNKAFINFAHTTETF